MIHFPGRFFGFIEFCKNGGAVEIASAVLGSGLVDLFGDSLPSVHIQQTSVDRHARVKRTTKGQDENHARLERNYRAWASSTRVALPVELAFRHRGWFRDRSKVRACMVRSGATAVRLERFDNCGAGCSVEAAVDGSGVRVKAEYCGDRWCLPCCKARSIRIVRNVCTLRGNNRLSFFTLTSRSASPKLAECITHVQESFRRLRQSKDWKAVVAGGISTIEVTRGAAGDHWHVHVHGLFCGKFMEQSRLSDIWRVASRGSYIVDIRAVRNGDKAIEYVASYAAKGWDRKLLNDQAAADEAMIALKGRRLLTAFGDWFNADIAEEIADNREWKSVGTLAFITQKALIGEDWAVRIMQAIRVRVEGGEGAVRFTCMNVPAG